MANEKQGGGFHIGIPANTDNIDSYYEKMASWDKAFFAKNVDNSAGLLKAQELMQNGHPGVIVYRILKGGDTPPYGQDIDIAVNEYLQKVRGNFPPELDKSLVWLELVNETTKDNDADVRWTWEFCRVLASRLVDEGYKFCGPGWATGNPEPYHYTVPEALDYFRLCEQLPDKVGVAIHEYSLDHNMHVDGWLIGRFRFIHDACDQNGIARPRIFITEFGWTQNSFPDNWTEQLIPVAEHYAQYPNIMGYAMWCLDTNPNEAWAGFGDVVNPIMVWNGQTTPWGETIKDILPDENPEPPEPPPSGDNLLVNGSFESRNWTDVQPAPDRLQQPYGWVLDVATQGTQLWAINRKTGQYPIAQSLPETTHKICGETLPPDECAGQPNALVLDGVICYKIQNNQGVLSGVKLRQSVTVEPGRKYQVVVNVQVHYHDDLNDDSPDDIELWVMVNGNLQRALWATDLPDREWVMIGVEYTAINTSLELEIRYQQKWANARDLFIDDFKVIKVGATEPQSFDEWLEETAEANRVIDYNTQAALQKAIVADGYAPYSGEVWDTFEGQEYALQGARDLTSNDKRVYFAAVGDWGNVQYITQGESPPAVNTRPPMVFQPLDSQSTETRGFGECPECYNDIPSYQPDCGHGGNDRGVPTGTKIYATQTGTVVHASDRMWNSDNPSGYGLHVVIQHNVSGQRFHSVYAHCSELLVGLGQGVMAGDYIAKVGSTGNSTGPHLHYGVMIDEDWGGCHGQLKFGYFVDPVYVFSLPLAPEHTDPPPQTKIDMLPYLRGDGRMYEVQHASGPTETFQSQWQDGRFYQVKNSQYEELAADGDFIWRGLDTSPGEAPGEAERPGELRYYVQFDAGKDMAKWCPRLMGVGQSWVAPAPHTVQFYYKSDCSQSSANSGSALNQITFVAHHAQKTWNGITVQDVIELKSPFETYFYAKGFGLVAWGMGDKQSAISEIHSGRPPLQRESGCWG